MNAVKEAPKPKTTNGPGITTPAVGAASTVPQKAFASPFNFVSRFAEEMDRLFEEFGVESGWHIPSLFTRGRELVRRETGIVPAEWSPRVEVIEREGQYVVKAELPGLCKDDVTVDVTNQVLTIQGKKTQEKNEEREGYCYSECHYGSFYRAIPLPAGVDATKATAEFQNGVLEVVIPRPTTAEPKARRLEIRPGT